MFKCNSCKKLSKPNENANKLIITTRNVVYYNKEQKPIGTGVETVKEVTVCNECKGRQV